MSGGKSSDELQIRTMRAHDVALALDWAAGEDWNPGLGDAACFAHADPAGFFIGEVDGRAAAIISTVNYDDRFAFLGLYIVRPDLRGRGYGLRVWNAGLAHAGNRSIGLDGVVAQQDNYRKSGFAFAYNNIRCGGVPAVGAAGWETVPLREIPLDLLVADDARVFPASRAAFWGAWIGAPGHHGRALLRDGSLAGWGVIRPCRTGRRIGPLIASDREAAEAVFAALVGGEGGEVFLDVPQPNAAAGALAREAGLSPVSETARMYKGPVRPAALDLVFGVASLELG